MKYRIKIVTYQTGRKVFNPQFKKGWSWRGIWDSGKLTFSCDNECVSRERALSAIDNHYAGNCKPAIIEFEYINKQLINTPSPK